MHETQDTPYRALSTQSQFNIEWVLRDNDLQEASNVREPIFYFFAVQFTATDHGCVTCFSVNVGIKHLHANSENESALALVRYITDALTLNLSLRILLYYVICVLDDWTVDSWLCSSQTTISLSLPLFASLSFPLFSEQKTNGQMCVCIRLVRSPYRHAITLSIQTCTKYGNKLMIRFVSSFTLRMCGAVFFLYCSI